MISGLADRIVFTGVKEAGETADQEVRSDLINKRSGEDRYQ